MEKIKVLALDDDNHARYYIANRTYYSDCADFVQRCLLKPHHNEYEVREVNILYPEGELADLSKDEFNEFFNLLESTYFIERLSNDELIKWDKAFELFWKNGEEWNYA